MKTNRLIQTKEDQENFNKLLELKKQHNSWASIISKSKSLNYLKVWLENKTPLLQDSKYTLITKLYWLVHDLIDFPNCQYCENNTCPLGFGVKQHRNIDSFEKGYFRACSFKCPKMQEFKQKKSENTNLKKYGSTKYFSSEVGKKVKQAWCEKNGVLNPFQLQEVKDKAKETRKHNFGYEYTMQSPEKRKLTSENYQAKTGFSHQFKNPDVKQKAAETKQKKKDDGVDLYQKRKLGNRARRYDLFLKNNEVVPNFTKEEFVKLNAKTQYTIPLSWHCKKCNKDFVSLLDQNFSSREAIPARCINCHPINVGTSNDEIELYEFVKQLDDKLEHNNRTVISPYELDIFSKKFKIAIEYDGLYWHSEGNGSSTKFYHLMKTEECEKQGIQLIHVFEDEWHQKKEIVKSRLKNLFGIYDKVIFARKCEVKVVDNVLSKQFQTLNHIQGAVNSKANLGLFYENELVSLMTFGKCRFDKKHEWELLRFCNKLGYHIPGAASKLLKHFERNYKPKNLVSYADRRWSQGKVYNVLGFSLKGKSSPNYWYITNNSQSRLSRLQFQKHKLKSKLTNFDPNKTEVENMQANGYHRIFDCGNLVFEKAYL